MSKFFSLISDGNGEVKYFNAEQRQAFKEEHISYKNVESCDSHSSISSFYGYIGEKADKINKYEYNPLTKEFVVDQINTVDDKCLVEKYCKKLNFKTIVPELNIKKIINPLKDIKAKKITKTELKLVLEWDSVWNSVWNSVRDSMWAYISSFFNIRFKFDFSSAITLWNKGFVPSFDGTKWRLHAGINAKIVWEGTIEELKEACK